ncbi:MAG: AarF/ABC1/UbiB kinase family protein [Anaerolineales bacterium]|nr:AarF/ABC1/UbiB kinase family protein [Anaerolineales bacterium]
MKTPRLRGRYLRILTFFAGMIVRFIYWELILRKIGFRQLARSTRPERFRREAMRFRALALRMGGVMIKVGQFLSSRLDILPPEITDTLADLQDEVPSEKFEDIRQLAESELGASLAEKFEWFDESPLAAASLGQVHRARLKGGEEADFVNVVVKVQRPSIASIVTVDLSALQRVGGWLMRYRPVREHADVPALLREFSATVYEEIDYQQEAGNAETFFENFSNDKFVNVPRVVRSLSTLRVLTLEDVFAIKITEYDAITAAGIDRSEVARKLLDTYLEQIFEDGFFHADPHPGNLFITPLPPAKGRKTKSVRWQLTFVDFGMVGRVPENLRKGLRETVVAIGTRDAARLIKSYKELGFLLPGADTQALEQASAAVFDRFWGMSMSELRNVRPNEVRDIGHKVRDVMVETPFQVPNDLLMLVRTVAILSGMCTGLDPNFNLWEQLSPYASKLVQEEATSAFSLDNILKQVGDVVQAFIALPSQASRMLAQMESGGLVVQSPQVTREVRTLGRSVDRLTGGIIFAAFLVSGVTLLNSGNGQLGGGLLGAAGATLLWVIFGGRNRN